MFPNDLSIVVILSFYQDEVRFLPLFIKIGGISMGLFNAKTLVFRLLQLTIASSVSLLALSP